MGKKSEAPWFGAAYYPEDWDHSVMQEDIQLMHEAGMNVVRIGEFAWSSMEPSDGEICFDWLDEVVNTMTGEDIAVIMGTPSATPPSWLTSKYPDMLMMHDTGVRRQHGERRHCCSNHPQYNAYTKRVVEMMAKRYAGHSGIIGWQIDNEICYANRGCFCPHCVDGYREFLKDKYHTINELNARLNLKLWSMEFFTFDDIPAPAERTWAHPSLIADWCTFQSLSNARFVSMQADILRKEGVTVPIGTDMMPVLEQDYITTNQNLDVVQFNHYHDHTNLYSLVFWNDFLRGLKDRPFWNTETSTCWGGATYPAGYRPVGFCTVNTWLSYAMGAEACLYWLWRSHWAGHEMMHGSVISSSGRPMHTFDEVKKIGSGLEKIKDVLTKTKVVSSGIGLHMSHNASSLFRAQSISKELDGWAVYIWKLKELFYKPLLNVQLRPDILDPSADISGYKVVITPFLPYLDEAGLKERIMKWVRNGGFWIVGPLTDIRTEDGTKYKTAPHGSIEELAGVRIKYQIPAYPQEFTAQFRNDTGFHCYVECAGYEAVHGTEILAQYIDEPLKGLAAITHRKYGKGSICVLGTVPSENAYAELIMSACDKAGISPLASAESNLAIIPREGNEKVMFCIEYMGKSGVLSLEHPAIDLLSGRKLSGDVTVNPFEVLCLKGDE